MSFHHIKTLTLISYLLAVSGLLPATVYAHHAVTADHAEKQLAANKQPMQQIIARGEQEHKTHCYKCHTDKVYTRKNHFVRSLDALSKQVKRCKNNTNAPWFDEDTNAVVEFLNQKYYKF